MSRFDEYVERREEERNRERYASLNAMIERSLKTRSREEVVLDLLGGLSIPLGSGRLPFGEGGFINSENYAKAGVGVNALVF